MEVIIIPVVKGFNNMCILDGNITIIHIEQRNGRAFDTFIDTEDLPILQKLDLPWHVMYTKNTDSYYAQASQYYRDEKGRRKLKVLLLHRIVTNAENGSFVDHENHDTLDNRKFNLRVTVNEKNTKHRGSKNKNNKSGYRNVSLIDNKWCVQLQVNGKNTCLGRFDNVDEAGIFAEEMREKHYGEYAGAS